MVQIIGPDTVFSCKLVLEKKKKISFLLQQVAGLSYYSRTPHGAGRKKPLFVVPGGQDSVLVTLQQEINIGNL